MRFQFGMLKLAIIGLVSVILSAIISPAHAIVGQSTNQAEQTRIQCHHDARQVEVMFYADDCPVGWLAGALPAAPAPAPVADAILGWTHATQPLEATGGGLRIDIGGGNNDHADLTTFNPAVLTPGSVVNIYHRDEPYTTAHLFHKDGTSDYPITIHGVTDASGTRPVFDCTNVNYGDPDSFGQYLTNLGFFVLSYDRDGGTYNDAVEHNTFQNLHIRNCAAAIRGQGVRHLTIQSNVIDTNNNGIFLSDVGGGAWSTKVRGNYFTNNGTSGGYSQHSIYFQGVAESASEPNVIEGNLFAEMLPSTQGMQIKTRATDTVIRYNTVYCQRICFEIAELQGGNPDLVYSSFSAAELRDRLHTSYVYGNQFYINDDNGGAVYPFHVGVDTGEGNGVFHGPSSGSAEGEVLVRGINGGVTYFYHNSVSITSDNYHQTLFGLGFKDNVISGYYGKLDAANNLFRVNGGANGRIAHCRLGCDLTYSGVNAMVLLGMEAAAPRDARANVTQESTSDVTITGDEGPSLVITRGSDSLALANAEPLSGLEIDFRLQAGSAAIGAAGALPAAIPAWYLPTLQPVPPSEGGGAIARSSANNLGAFE